MESDVAWQMWGERDPYYGVLTDPKYRAAVLTPADKAEFFLHGEHQAAHVLRVCGQYLQAQFAPQRVLDFGCGVGRLAIPFARHAREVVAMDIAPSMLAEAGRNCAEFGAANVQLVMSDDVLTNAPGQFDLVHSSIVLQHLEVTRGRQLFQQLVGKVAPGGCGALHVTFAWARYVDNFGQPPGADELPPLKPWAPLRAWLVRLLRRPAPPVQAVNPDPEMQMNYYNLSALHYVLVQAGVKWVFTEFTDHGGALGAMLYFQR